ncbi:hypothetical protein [Staphylococcus sp. LCT-H4]|uniref:hypothetical protein n=1 Tax=Staphylococcus sp. LCT-H4 TaxID=1914308 RepID=UPI0008F50182|nr:hypothetical protein [Staphylococcus sp. LCT-H4]OIJ29089.1 hypothetical protein BK821_12165 [Staphylococcus sp. LCT-H4]
MPLFESNQATKISSKNKINNDNQEVLFKEDSTSSLFGKQSNNPKESMIREKTEPLFSKHSSDEHSEKEEHKKSSTLFASPNIEKKKFKLKNRTRIKRKNKPLNLFKSHKPKKTFLDITNIIDRTDESSGGLFVLRDGTYMKFFQVHPKDIMSRNSNEQLYDMGVLLNMLKAYNKDNKILALNMPIDTEQQRTNLIKKHDNIDNDIHKYFLEKRIEKFEYLEQSSRMERSFLAMVFGTTPQELRINLQTYKNAMSGGFPIKMMSEEQEIKILYKLNNQCEEIK